ncbi:hypothetical protein LY76DRAFT_271300 [Colletotrichum caudatum]|nr:hypothetical protein LY76DRAFT_271300 [Colletotrichum caudatum]
MYLRHSEYRNFTSPETTITPPIEHWNRADSVSDTSPHRPQPIPARDRRRKRTNSLPRCWGCFSNCFCQKTLAASKSQARARPPALYFPRRWPHHQGLTRASLSHTQRGREREEKGKKHLVPAPHLICVVLPGLSPARRCASRVPLPALS